MGDGAAHAPNSIVRWRIRRGAIVLAIIAICLNSSPGLIVPDTKLDLTQNPWGFLERALHLWDRSGFGGQLQNQAFGYFFPMGPFFGLGEVIGLPGWVTQRLWWSLVLTVAFLGMTALIERLKVASGFAATVGGLAYAFSPHLLTVLGPVSSEIWPMALAPLVLLPMVGVGATGSLWRASARSALAVVCMGAINATAVFAAVLPTGLWLVTRPVGRRMVRVLLIWCTSVLVACLWWVIPLLTLGRYSPPFLDYIENAAIVTSTMTLFEAIRGTGDWTAYLPQQGWVAGLLLLTKGAVVMCTGLVVVAGLIGLGRRQMPHRRFLIGLFLLGVVILCAGHVGSPGGLAPLTVQAGLDGALAPLRNVHKFDLFVRIPLALGLASVVTRFGWGASHTERRLTRSWAMAATVMVMLGAAAPATALRLAPDGGFAEVPTYWAQTARWLADQRSAERALVVPSARFAYFLWGRPKDEPLQPLATSPWEVRDAVPMVPPQHIRMLNEIGALFDAGTPSASLSAYLRESGLRYLVVRNDLDYVAAGAPAPALVHAVLDGSVGLQRVASFGPNVGAVGTEQVAIDEGLQQSYPAVEIYAVSGAPRQAAALVPASALTVATGGPEGLLGATAPADPAATTVLAGDLRAAGEVGVSPGRSVVTDSLRRTDVNFGRNGRAASQTLTATEGFRVPKLVPDYLPTWAPGQQTVAEFSGIRGVSALTSASDASTATISVPGDQPWAALDRDPATAWRTAPVTNPNGQWLQVDLAEPTPIPSLDLTLTKDGNVTALRVETDVSAQDVALSQQGSVQHLVLSSGDRPVSWVRITFTRVTGLAIEAQQVGISSLTLPGIQPQRWLRVPVPSDIKTGDTTSSDTKPVDTYAFSARSDASPGCLILSDRPLCAAGLAHQGEDSAGLFRRFGSSSAGAYGLSVTLTPRGSPELDVLIAQASAAAVSATVSSSVVPDPMAGATSLLDGDPLTTWTADPRDADPSLTLTFPTERVVSTLNLTLPPAYAGTAPQTLTLTAGTFTQTVPVIDPGQVVITPVRARQLSITLHSPQLRTSLGGTAGAPLALGLGLAGVSVEGVPPLDQASIDARPVTVPCGAGPLVLVDGRRIATSIATTVGVLRREQPVTATICDDAAVQVAPGEHSFVAASTPAFAVAGARLDLTGTEPADGVSAPPGQVRRVELPMQQPAPDTGSVEVPARSETSLLVVNENANPGWQATLDGARLATLAVNGWQQGYVLPAGAAGRVDLVFAPSQAYRTGLGIGALGVLATLAIACWPRRRTTVLAQRAPLPVPVPGAAMSRWRVLHWQARALAVPGLTMLTALIVGGALGGVAALVILIACQLRVPRPILPTLAALGSGLAFGIAAAAVAQAPAYSQRYAAPSIWVQILCVVAVALLGASVLRGREVSVLRPAAEGPGLARSGTDPSDPSDP